MSVLLNSDVNEEKFMSLEIPFLAALPSLSKRANEHLCAWNKRQIKNKSLVKDWIDMF